MYLSHLSFEWLHLVEGDSGEGMIESVELL